jgi:NAD(P)-dependent dehydrogenase (short-subunit alcohol dehydrogenase family)
MPDALKDKVVLITGATGTVGSAVTRTLAQTGARLALASRSAQGLVRLAAEVELPADRVFTIVADITQPDQVPHLVKAILSEFGQIDVLLNTVGGWSGGKIVEETPIEDWMRMLSLNLYSAFMLSVAILPGMLQSGWGRIVHIGSKMAVEPRPRQAGYVVSKMGLIALTEAIATEVKGTGVTANVVLPSIIDTKANRKRMPRANLDKRVHPDQIAAAMCFLCSDAAASINGMRIPEYDVV